VSLKNSRKRANLKLGWIQCEKSSQVWLITKVGLVDLPPGRKAMRCGWIYKAKKNDYGAVYRLKSRLVAKGYSQKSGIDYNDTFAPVGDKVILRFVPSFTLHLGYELYQLDIETAYLYGNLKETIYMIQPEGFDDGSDRVSTSKVHLWPQAIGKRMVLSALKFPEINWIRNLSKGTMLDG